MKGAKQTASSEIPLEEREMNRKHVLCTGLCLTVLVFAGACKPEAPGATAPALEEGQPGAGTEPAAGGGEAAPAVEEASAVPAVDQDRPAVTVKVKTPVPSPPVKVADPAGASASQLEHSIPAKLPEREKKPNPILQQEATPGTEFDKCMKLCTDQNMMRAVAWEVIEADCRAECKKKPGKAP
jgi:hypothetical protein